MKLNNFDDWEISAIWYNWPKIIQFAGINMMTLVSLGVVVAYNPKDGRIILIAGTDVNETWLQLWSQLAEEDAK